MGSLVFDGDQITPVVNSYKLPMPKISHCCRGYKPVRDLCSMKGCTFFNCTFLIVESIVTHILGVMLPLREISRVGMDVLTQGIKAVSADS